MLEVIQFNLLAPIWVNDLYKQLPCYEEFSSPDRVEKVIDYLKSLPKADIYCLSEVLARDIELIKKSFSGYSGVHVANDPNYWKEWLSKDYQKVLPNGVLLLGNDQTVRMKKYEVLEYGDGGKCLIVNFEDLKTGKKIRATSLHFDTTDKKYIESEKLIKKLNSLPKVDLEIVAGDFNYNDVNIFNRLDFGESVRNKQISTIPFYADGKGKIDHTLVKGAESIYGKLYTVTSFNDVSSRMCQTVAENGSDHFATFTKIIF